ncbi:phosphatidate cytidylyltransferase [Oceanisphaera avium]|uniref:Phosphatidate cytidylyltransferase n=1 Tax=Oceanisphaera avium TaxID=1903694 RepID=A0A1Y0CU74_9GAMM|nr:phosphatidate cytidylyltransferase [Oceanisphaera avium]ART78842.1 phosphatidate cytidylyltransferase [Oceanisphaera avium]
MLKLRVITALCLVPLVLAALFLLPYPYFIAFVGGIFLIAAREWSNFIDPDKALVLTIGLVLMMYGITAFVPFDNLWVSPASVATLAVGLHEAAAWLLVATGVWWLIALIMVFTYPSSAKTWREKHNIKTVFAMFTLLPFMVAVLALRSFAYQDNPQAGAWLLLFVMGLVWAADTGAYFVGKAIGKRKLCPNVSPGKTLEGMIGGVVAAAILALVVVLNLELAAAQTQVILIASIAAAFASVLGDLTESMFKREAGLKDSGNILPGHGGIMDRIDGLTAALPVFVLVVWLLS